MKKLFCSLWFVIFAALSVLLVMVAENIKPIMPYGTREPFRIPIMLMVVFMVSVVPWAYIFGSRISYDTNKSLNGIVDSIKIGFIITLLMQITFLVICYVLWPILFTIILGQAYDWGELFASILSGIMLMPLTFILMMFMSALIVFPLSAFWSALFWSFIALHHKFFRKNRAKFLST